MTSPLQGWEVLEVPCPTCKAPAGATCFDAPTHHAMKAVHNTRVYRYQVVTDALAYNERILRMTDHAVPSTAPAPVSSVDLHAVARACAEATNHLSRLLDGAFIAKVDVAFVRDRVARIAADLSEVAGRSGLHDADGYLRLKDTATGESKPDPEQNAIGGHATLAQPAVHPGWLPPAIDVAHLERQRSFSRHTFGPGRRTQGVLAHIRKELDEIEAAPDDLSEWINVVILALDGAWRAGHDPETIIRALIDKQTRNEARDWPDWRATTENQPIEHVRTEGAAKGAHETPEIRTDDYLPATCPLCRADLYLRWKAYAGLYRSNLMDGQPFSLSDAEQAEWRVECENGHVVMVSTEIEHSESCQTGLDGCESVGCDMDVRDEFRTFRTSDARRLANLTARFETE